MPVMPPTLAPGALVRVVSPSLPAMAYWPDRVEKARASLEHMGLRVEFSRNCFEISDDGRSAGSAKERADDINEAFADPNVDALLSAVGGNTTKEIIPYLDTSLIQSNPKIFIGRSDNVYLNAYLLENAQICSFYGATFIPQFGNPGQPMQETIDSFTSVLIASDEVRYRAADQHYNRLQEPPKPGCTTWLAKGTVTAPLVGGEVSIICDLLESNMLSLDGAILFWDLASDEEGYLECQFNKICELENLRTLAGMIVADSPWMPFNKWTKSVANVLRHAVGDLNYPVLVGADCGHYPPSWVLPYGDIVTLSADSGLVYRGDSQY